MGRIYATYRYLYDRFTSFYSGTYALTERQFGKWKPKNIEKAKFDTCMFMKETFLIFLQVFAMPVKKVTIYFCLWRE